MKMWHSRTDRDDRGQGGRDRDRHRARPTVEAFEVRILLSTASKAATVPAAYKPPANSNPKFPPYDISAEIDPISDPAGSGTVFRQEILIDGHAPPFSTLWLAIGTRPGYFTNITTADGTGYYVFEVPVSVGKTTLQVFAEDPAQDYSNVATVNVTRGNAIVAWDSIALKAMENQGTTPDEAARDLAVIHSAQYDAVAAVDFPNSAYQVHATAPKGASAEAAADSSAYTVLNGLFPSLKQTFLNAYAAAVAGLKNNTSTQEGLSLGIQVGNQTLSNRANDGSDVPLGFNPSDVPGFWRPTPPTFSPAVDAQFAHVTPFEITSPSEYRPSAPPSVGSVAYDQALQQVATLGASDSSVRTASQTSAAKFWSDPVGSENSPGPWNLIAEQLSVSHKDKLDTDARLFAQLDFALADTAIASADSQYTYDEWRPVSAIQQTDPTFTPLVTTPASPSYVSNSAAFGGAAADVLSAEFGKKTSFTAVVNNVTGLSRSFTTFAAAATEDASSQVWGGISFSFDAQAGLDLGTQVAQGVLSNFPKGK